MGHRLLSIDTIYERDEPNDASMIRDAVLEVIPEKLHGNDHILDLVYRAGQLSLAEGLKPDEAAKKAKSDIGNYLIQISGLMENDQKELISV
jgi:hypothetical protein